MEVSSCASSTATASLLVIGGALEEALAEDGALEELEDDELALLLDELDDELEELEELDELDEALEELDEDDCEDELEELLCSSSEKSISSFLLFSASAISGSSEASSASSPDACCGSPSSLISPPLSMPSLCSPCSDCWATSPLSVSPWRDSLSLLEDWLGELDAVDCSFF